MAASACSLRLPSSTQSSPSPSPAPPSTPQCSPLHRAVQRKQLFRHNSGKDPSHRSISCSSDWRPRRPHTLIVECRTHPPLARTLSPLQTASREPDCPLGSAAPAGPDRPHTGLPHVLAECCHGRPLLDHALVPLQTASEGLHSFLGNASLSYLLALPNIAGFNIEGPQSVLEALAVLAGIITVHECGHFFAAYIQGIHISQFSIGFGPTLFKLQGKRVEYSLRAIPLGGFVGFPDDDPESDYAPNDPDLLKNRPILDRLLVTSAGVIANIVFAYCILFGQVITSGLLQQELLPGVIVPEVISSSIAARAGLQTGDVIMGVNGAPLVGGESAVYDLVHIIKASPNSQLSFQVLRKNDPINIRIVPEQNFDGSGRIGVQLAPHSKPVKVKAKNLADATVRASKEFSRLFGTVVEGLRQVVFNFAQTADKISGPVAIVAVGAEVARTDAAGLSQFAAIVNINLAVVNILPLPALDGGYLLLIAVEALRGGKKMPKKVEQGIMSSGIVLLLALGVFLMVRDALNLGIVQLL